MRTVAGILLLLAGVIFPMMLVAWLSNRLNHKPRPTPRQVGLLLAFNGLLPLALVSLGVGLVSEALWATIWLRAITLAAWLAALIILVLLFLVTRRGQAGGQSAG